LSNASQRDAVQRESVDQLRDEVGYSLQREIGVGSHSVAVGAERQRRRDHSVVARELGDHVGPQ
jgi:hypothetical protein